MTTKSRVIALLHLYDTHKLTEANIKQSIREGETSVGFLKYETKREVKATELPDKEKLGTARLKRGATTKIE